MNANTSKEAIQVIGCELPNIIVTSGNPTYWNSTGKRVQAYVLVANSKDGNITNSPTSMNYYENRKSKVVPLINVWRSGGATDGSNNYSFYLTTSTNAVPYSYNMTPLLSKHITAGSHTLTVHIASTGIYDNSQLYLDVFSPNETPSPNTTSQGVYKSTRANILDSPSSITSDSGVVWVGSGVNYPQKISVQLNPAIDGTLYARLIFNKINSTLYYDPLLDVT